MIATGVQEVLRHEQLALTEADDALLQRVLRPAQSALLIVDAFPAAAVALPLVAAVAGLHAGEPSSLVPIFSPCQGMDDPLLSARHEPMPGCWLILPQSNMGLSSALVTVAVEATMLMPAGQPGRSPHMQIPSLRLSKRSARRLRPAGLCRSAARRCGVQTGVRKTSTRLTRSSKRPRFALGFGHDGGFSAPLSVAA